MYRSHSCGELRESQIDKDVTLSGWVQKTRDKGFVVWIDLRDRYGITQLIFDEERTSSALLEQARSLGREFVVQIKGEVIERASKNPNLPTGNIEVLVEEVLVLNESKTPPFTIENETDGGEDIRMKYRYLDIRRNPVKDNLIFRSKVSMEVRKYLTDEGFIEVETPYLIKSTQVTVSALINFFSKSVWITPAAFGAKVFFLTVQALLSSGPEVKKVSKLKRS